MTGPGTDLATAIVGATVVRPDGIAAETVTFRGDRLVAPPDRAAGRAPDRVIDADGLTVCPGFIDLQINGGHGIDLATEPEAMWELGRLLPRHGVTGFLPTIITSPAALTDRAIAAIGRRPEHHAGAEPLGLHLEGPMLSPARPGAHPVDRLVAPGPDVVDGWSRAAGVALVTLAPELDGALDVTTRLVERGVVVSAGHSDATADEARWGIDAGITMATHLFNAMAPLGHRDPGLVGLTLADPRVTAGLIADGVHVDPLVSTAVWRAKGPDRIALVTDAVAPMGLGPGDYRLGRTTLRADERSVRTLNGTLAGSVLTMDGAVRNIVATTGCRLEAAVTAATTTPADVLGLSDRGRIDEGAVADLTVLDADLEVVMTICAGRIDFVADRARDRIDPPTGG